MCYPFPPHGLQALTGVPVPPGLVNREPAGAVIQQQQKNRGSGPGDAYPKKLIPLVFEARNQFFQVIQVDIPMKIATRPAIPDHLVQLRSVQQIRLADWGAARESPGGQYNRGSRACA